MRNRHRGRQVDVAIKAAELWSPQLVRGQHADRNGLGSAEDTADVCGPNILAHDANLSGTGDPVQRQTLQPPQPVHISDLTHSYARSRLTRAPTPDMETYRGNRARRSPICLHVGE